MRKFISRQQTLNRLCKDDDNQSVIDLLQPFQGLKGSLNHEVLPEFPLLATLSPVNASEYSQLCLLLPPVKEGCLTSDEAITIEETVKHFFSNIFVKILLIHKHSRGILSLELSLNSVHASSSMVYISNGIHQPEFVRKYVAVEVILQSPS